MAELALEGLSVFFNRCRVGGRRYMLSLRSAVRPVAAPRVYRVDIGTDRDRDGPRAGPASSLLRILAAPATDPRRYHHRSTRAQARDHGVAHRSDPDCGL